MKKFLVISRKKAFLIFWETKTQKKVLIFQEAKLFYVSVSNFTSSKNKKLLIFWKTELIALKNLIKLPWATIRRLLVAQASSFIIHPFPLTQLVKLGMDTNHLLCSACVTYRTLRHVISHQVPPTQPFRRQSEDFPRGEKYFNHVRLLR